METSRWSAMTVSVLAVTICLSAGTGAIGAAAKKKTAAKKPAAAGKADIATGKKFVETDGCLACHKIGAKGAAGGAPNTDLTKVGARAKAPQIAAKLKNPKKDNPNTIMPPSRRPDKEVNAMAAYLASLK
jgi:mono/diheme cytochrome c family protein